MIDQLLNVLAVLAWIWFLVVVAMIVIRAYQIGGLQDVGRTLFSARVFIALCIAVGMSLLSASLVFIEPQEVGVVISVLNRNGYRDAPLRSGLHLVVPLAERVVRYPIYWQTYTMSSDAVEGSKNGNDSIAARTSDGQAVYIDSSIIYRIDPGEAIRVHIDLQERYIDDFIRPVMRGVVRTEVSQFTADEVNSSKRKNLEANLDELLRQALAEKGFTLDRFLLRNIAFSSQFATAIEQKQVAEQEQKQREYQAEQMRKLAEGERDRMKIEADGQAAAIQVQAAAQANATVMKARAEAEALRLISQTLQKDKSLLLYNYIQKLSPNIKVMLVPNNNPYLLTLPDMNGDLSAGGTSVPLPSFYTSTITTTMGLTNTLPLALPTPTP